MSRVMICETFYCSASKSLHSLHKIHVELRTLERKLSNSEKRLSVPIYPELDMNIDEKIVEEENNLLGGDVERLNGKVPTVSIKTPILHYPVLTFYVPKLNQRKNSSELTRNIHGFF